MSLKTEALLLRSRLKSAEGVLSRVTQNRAYARDDHVRAIDLLDRIRKELLVIPGLIEQVSTLAMLDPLGHLRPNRHLDLSIQLENLVVELESHEQVARELVQSHEGRAAVSRWLDTSTPHTPLAVPRASRIAAVIVGVGDYNSRGLACLSTPVHDAETICNLFTDLSGGECRQSIVTLCDAQATPTQYPPVLGECGR
jgi:hypothetical protein